MTPIKLNKNQIAIMKHTIKNPGRNWFSTGYKDHDSIDFEKLVKEGYATKQTAPDWTCDDVIYSLTKEGIERINNE